MKDPDRRATPLSTHVDQRINRCVAVKRCLYFALTAALALSVGACWRSDAGADRAIDANPFFTESPLPFQLPPFDQIEDAHYVPAFERGMAEQLAEINTLVTTDEPPTFENTLVAFERSGLLLYRVEAVFVNLTAADTNDTLDAIDRDMAPKLAAHRDQILLNGPLFARVRTLYDTRETLDLDAESQRLIEEYYRDFVRAGAELSAVDQARVCEMNVELAELTTTFGQHVLSEANASAVIVVDRDELAGLSEAEITAAAEAAAARGLEGQYLLALLNTSGQPPLVTLQNRALRQRIMEVSLARGSHGGDFDTRAIVTRIARLRAERAALLGYRHHAAYSLEEQTARTVEAVNERLASLAPAAVRNAEREAADLQAAIDEDGGGFDLAAWDWAYYAEQVRRARYDFDATELRPYFELNRVLRDGVFYAATELYGIALAERTDLAVYHPDVRVFDVFEADGTPLALFLFDPYARPSKRGGAWMTDYVSQSALLGRKAVVANHLNVPKPAEGEPTLLTFTEVETLFHEFGHALHGMFSTVRYPYFSGTAVPRDFVEYPSQVNEMWATWPEVLQHYAVHHETGEPMPAELLDRVLAAEQFNQGFATTEYLAASLLDQAWHQLTPEEVPDADSLLAFEAAALKNAGVALAAVPARYRSTYFSHIFNVGYAAGYYSYIWAEVLDADSVEWFKEHGGLRRENGEHFRQTLLSRGSSRAAMALFRDFRGAEPDIAPLLKRRGLN